MIDFEDRFWEKPHRSRREIAADLMSRLRLDSPTEHPSVQAARAKRDAERLLRHDRMFGIDGRTDDEIAKSLRLGVDE